jgi:hypothetical protein
LAGEDALHERQLLDAGSAQEFRRKMALHALVYPFRQTARDLVRVDEVGVVFRQVALGREMTKLRLWLRDRRFLLYQ